MKKISPREDSNLYESVNGEWVEAGIDKYEESRIFPYIYEKLDDKKISKLIHRSNRRRPKVKEAFPSTYKLVESSHVLNRQELSDLLSGGQRGVKVIEFTKKGCRGCSAVKPFYEDLNTKVKAMRKEIARLELTGQKYDHRRASPISDYNIKNLENFREIEVMRFNIHNDVNFLITFIILDEYPKFRGHQDSPFLPLAQWKAL